MSAASKEREHNSKKTKEEEPDEWTVLAKTYAQSLVPSMAPIYVAMANLLQQENPYMDRILDFGCGPGEPSLTLLSKLMSLQKVVGVDSTKSMLEIAQARASEKQLEVDKVSFCRVPRDVTMKEFKALASKENDNRTFDAVVSSFVLSYLEFPRRVEVTRAFLEMAPRALLVTWGEQSKVGWLRAIKTFGTWKRDDNAEKNICDVKIAQEDDGNPASPTNSFTMPRQDNFQAIVDEIDGAKISSFETKTLVLTFSSVRALLSFLPMPICDEDCQAAWKLLQSWNNKEVTLGSTIDDELSFPCEIVFCQILLQFIGSGTQGGVKRKTMD